MPTVINVEPDLDGRYRVKQLATSGDYRIVLRRKRAEFLRITSAGCFNNASAVLLPGAVDLAFSAGAASELPTHYNQTDIERAFGDDLDEVDESPTFVHGCQPRVRSVSRLLVAFMQAAMQRPERSAVISGHCSTSGSSNYNQELFEARAACAFDLLRGDRGALHTAWQAHHHEDDDITVVRDLHACLGLPTSYPVSPGDPRSADRVFIACFQSEYNDHYEASIAVDGLVGEETRGAMADRFFQAMAMVCGSAQALDELRAALVFSAPESLGAGEDYPASVLRQNYRDDDRRVELLLFDPSRHTIARSTDIYGSPESEFDELPVPGLEHSASSVTIGEPNTQRIPVAVDIAGDIDAQTEAEGHDYDPVDDPWWFVDHVPNGWNDVEPSWGES